MNAMRRRLSVGLAAVFWAICWGGTATAHRPVFPDGDASAWQNAIQIDRPAVSQVVYYELQGQELRLWLTFVADAGFEVFLQLGLPKIDRLADYRPSFALLGSGFEPIDLPFDTPEGLGGRVFTTEDVSDPRVFHEPFTDTTSWIVKEVTVTLPQSGRYYVVAWPNGDAADKLWLSIGREETFGLGDLFLFDDWTGQARQFHEVPPALFFGIPCFLLTVLPLLFLSLSPKLLSGR